MSKHRERVQFRRKIAARNADKTRDALMDIYRRATQGGSEGYLVVNQESEPDRVAKIYVNRTGSKIAGTYAPKGSGRFADSREVSYERLKSGQIVGHPLEMRRVKAVARETRLIRREKFRAAK